MGMSFFVDKHISLKKSILFFSDAIRFKTRNLPKKALIQKRTSSFIFSANASLSLEAAVVFPLFLSACLAILFFAELFRLETRVNEVLYNTSKVYAQCAGLIDNDNTPESELFRLGLNGVSLYALSDELNKELNDGFDEMFLLSKGNTVFALASSKVDDNYIDLIYKYKVKFNVPFFSLPEIPIVQRCRFHTWSGKEREQKNDDDTIVYITPAGEVYHKNKDCTYIKLSIQSVIFSQVSEKRNNSGAKYYACDRCIKNNSVNGTVYITEYGTKYHNSLSCSELKRTVQEVKLSQVKDTRRPCSKCGL